MGGDSITPDGSTEQKERMDYRFTWITTGYQPTKKSVSMHVIVRTSYAIILLLLKAYNYYVSREFCSYLCTFYSSKLGYILLGQPFNLKIAKQHMNGRRWNPYIEWKFNAQKSVFVLKMKVWLNKYTQYKLWM